MFAKKQPGQLRQRLSEVSVLTRVITFISDSCEYLLYQSESFLNFYHQSSADEYLLSPSYLKWSTYTCKLPIYAAVIKLCA